MPRFLLMRDVLYYDEHSHELTAAEKAAMQSTQVLELCSRQHPDGSFGRFAVQPSMDIPNGGVNETAMIRALSLGLTSSHPTMVRLGAFLEEVLSQAQNRPMPVARSLILASCLRQLNSSDPTVMAIVDKWRSVLETSFGDDNFQASVFRDKCEDVFGPDNDQWPEQWPELGFSRYSLLLMKDQLPFRIEKSMINYLINKTRGIYPISNRSLLHVPLIFASREGLRFIAALELLTNYISSAPFLLHAAEWLWEQIGINGYWDLGSSARDNRHFPLSPSWQSPKNRQWDCTVRILSLLVKLQQTCDLYEKTCHPL